MTFIDRINGVSTRFLRERTYELIVAPAIADVQHDREPTNAFARMRNHLSLLLALAGGAYEDLTTDSSVLTFAGLAMIPAAYYALLMLVIFCLPGGSMQPAQQIRAFLASSGDHLGLVALLVVMSCAPVVACCWPERKDA